MGVLAFYASRTCIVVVIPTSDPITGVIVVDVVAHAHGRKEKDGCFKFSKRSTFIIEVSQRY